MNIKEKSAQCWDAVIKGRFNDAILDKIEELVRENPFIGTQAIAVKINEPDRKRVNNMLAALKRERGFNPEKLMLDVTRRYFDEHYFSLDIDFARYIKKTPAVAKRLRQRAGVPSAFDKMGMAKQNFKPFLPKVSAIADANENVCGDELVCLVADEMRVPERMIRMCVLNNKEVPLDIRRRFFNPISPELEELIKRYTYESIAFSKKGPFLRLAEEKNIPHKRLKEIRVLFAHKNGYANYQEFWDEQKDEFCFEKGCALRPSEYVEDVCGQGYFGVNLPDEMFSRYLAIREKRKKLKPIPEVPFEILRERMLNGEPRY